MRSSIVAATALAGIMAASAAHAACSSLTAAEMNTGSCAGPVTSPWIANWVSGTASTPTIPVTANTIYLVQSTGEMWQAENGSWVDLGITIAPGLPTTQTYYAGYGNPQSALGNNGDVYVNGQFWLKISGTWTQTGFSTLSAPAGWPQSVVAVGATGSGVVYGTTGQQFGTGDLSGGYVVTPSSLKFANPATYTMETWVYLATAPSSTRVALGADNIGWLGVATNGDFAYALGTGSQVTSTVNIANGQWHLLDLVQNNGTGSVYVDGTQVASASDTAATESGGIGIGVYGYQGSVLTSFQWTGLVDEVSLWTTAKYSASFSPPTSPYTGSETGLMSLYHLDGNLTNSAANP